MTFAKRNRTNITPSRTSSHGDDPKLIQLEILVDELLKESPHEARVKSFMKAAGLEYCTDPVVRMNSVLSALNGFSDQFQSSDSNGQSTPTLMRQKDL